MSVGKCFGLGDVTTWHNTSMLSGTHPDANKYVGESFFDGKNYKSILECLDGGKCSFLMFHD